MVANESRVKTESLSKQVAVLEQLRYEAMDDQQRREPAMNPQIEIELSSLKETVLLDRQRSETHYDEVNRLYQGLVIQTHSIKADLMSKLKEHRDEYLYIFN